mmetsp:Transcript_15037/g.38230  ORF Transcript_15037/g.38230 Transcript_15037/m.38230 type:complete len:476 (-) Transcript_15037:240-1667(-)
MPRWRPNRGGKGALSDEDVEKQALLDSAQTSPVQLASSGPALKTSNAMRRVNSEDQLMALMHKGGAKLDARIVRGRKPRVVDNHWVCISKEGHVTKIKADKRGLTKAKEIGVNAREMRMFDPVYEHLHGQTTRILVRENALLFVMEGYKLIITKDEVFVPLSPNVSELIKELESVLKRRSTSVAKLLDPKQFQGSTDDADADEDEEVLPFELTALEVALKMVTDYVKDNVEELDQSAHPALERLLKKVDKSNLETVRNLKNKHSTVTKKVEAVVEELERIMDDDDDMRMMILDDTFFIDIDQQSVTSPRTPSGRRSRDDVWERKNSDSPDPSPQQPPGVTPIRSMGISTTYAAPPAGDDEHKVMVVENLLEFYFAVMDHSFDRLKTLEEIIENTEEMVNIELDTSRNRLIQLEILLTGSTFAFTIYAVVAGILGENLVLPESITNQFLLVNMVTLGICFAVMIGLYTWCKYENLV